MAFRPWLRPSSIASRNASHKLIDGTGWGGSCSKSLNSTPNPVVTALSLAGFAVLAFAFPFVERFAGGGVGETVLAGSIKGKVKKQIFPTVGKFLAFQPL